jgi:hypothetical protein
MQREVLCFFTRSAHHSVPILLQVKTRAAVAPIVSVPGTQMKLKSLR